MDNQPACPAAPEEVRPPTARPPAPGLPCSDILSCDARPRPCRTRTQGVGFMTGSQPAGSSLTAFARSVIEAAVRHGSTGRVPTGVVENRPHSGVFVTLYRFGRLRGCMGTLDPQLPLEDALRDAAVNAATRDLRFSPVAPGELADLSIEVSVLSAPQPMRSLDELIPGVHGVLVRSGSRRGLFLPKVATEHHLTREQLLERCCVEKAGLAADAWRRPGTEVLLFTAEVYAEAQPGP